MIKLTSVFKSFLYKKASVIFLKRE